MSFCTVCGTHSNAECSTCGRREVAEAHAAGYRDGVEAAARLLDAHTGTPTTGQHLRWLLAQPAPATAECTCYDCPCRACRNASCPVHGQDREKR